MTEATGGRSAGALLRAARERQGLHIAALAAAIKVAPRKLDALENDRWDELPDATFTRALAQTVCRTLKIDARPVLELLPSGGAVPLEPGDGTLNTPFRSRSGRRDEGWGAGAVRPMVWTAVVLMAAAMAVYFLPDGLLFDNRAAAPVAAVVVAPPASAVESGAVAPTAAASDAAVGIVAAASAASGPLDTPIILVAADSAASPAASAASTAAGIVQLRVGAGGSWVEARDAGGKLLLFRTVQAGENVGLDGRLPIRLIIGNASATQVEFRGQPVDAAARTRNNIARLELQ